MTGASDTILRFWFGDDIDDPATRAQHARLWFAHDPAFDAQIREKFAGDHALAARGTLDHWRASAAGSLALILLLDQFSRNLYRGQPGAFAHDEAALKVCLEGIDGGQDAALGAVERSFFYMPMEHAEKVEIQRLGEQHYRRLLAEAPEGYKKAMQRNLDHMVEHRQIIERFGRFPHRNETLGRVSSPEELAYLASGGKRFGQA